MAYHARYGICVVPYTGVLVAHSPYIDPPPYKAVWGVQEPVPTVNKGGGVVPPPPLIGPQVHLPGAPNGPLWGGGHYGVLGLGRLRRLYRVNGSAQWSEANGPLWGGGQ